MAPSMLSSLPYFRELPGDVLAALDARVRRLDLERDVRIVEEGQAADSIFFLGQGSVRVTRAQSGELLDLIQAPTLFGEMGIVADMPRLADVTTAEPCTIFEIQRDDIAALTAHFPALRETILAFHRYRLMRNVLRSSPLFSPIDERHKDELARGFVTLTAGAGECLLTEGAPGRGLFLLLRGSCDVVHREAEREVRLNELAEGDIFGEISLVMFDRPCTATVRAKTDCVVLLLDRDLVQRHLMSNPTVRAEVVKLALTRLRQTESVVARLKAPVV